MVSTIRTGLAFYQVTVCSSRTRHTDRFVCREALGYGGVPAGFLAPVPADSVVYGSGESAVILSRVRACHRGGHFRICLLYVSTGGARAGVGCG